MQNFPGLAIIIVSYNLKKDTLECIDSYVASGASPDQIIIVDNRSSDGTIESIKEKYQDSLHIILSESNRGYPHALNLGIPYAKDLGSQWILLSNNDVIVDRNFISAVRAAVESNPNISLFSPLILYHQAPGVIWYCGEKIIPGTLIGLRRYRNRTIPDAIPAFLNTDMVHGCAMLVNEKVFNHIGLFDDAELIYGDDADFSWRAKQAGFKAAVATGARMWHKVSLTINPQKPRTRYLRIRNTIQFYKRYTNGLSRIIMIIFTMLRGIVLSGGDIIRGQPNLIKPLWQGWLSGWLD